jgi:integrase
MARELYIWYDEIPLKYGGTSVKAFIKGFDPRNPKKQLTKTRPTRELAEAWVAEQVHTLNEGTWQDPAKHKRPLRYYAEVWWAIKRETLRETTLRSYERWLHKHVLVRFGDEKVGDITETEVELFLATKLRHYSPKTVNEILNVLHGVLETARKDKARRDNPANDKRLTVPDYEGVALTMEQIIDFIAYVPEHYQAAVWVIIYTGLRSGETWGLHINDLDWDTGQAKVVRTYGTTGGYGDISFGHGEGPVKTRKGNRDVHIPDFILEQLEAEITARGLDRYSSEPLFLNKHGRQVNRDTFQQRIIIPAARKAGLPKGFRVHDLRRTHISLLLDLGANVKAISQEAGHADERVTLRKYGRVYPGAMEKLTTLISGAHLATLEARGESNVVPFVRKKVEEKVERSSDNPGQTRTNGS